MMKLIRTLPLLAALVQAQDIPTLIRGLAAVNTASLAAADIPAHGVAPGARFALFGRNLGPTEPVTQLSADAATLAGVSIKVTTGGETLDASVMFVSERRIEALLPLHAALGDGTVSVDASGVTLTAPIRVVERSVGLVTTPVRVNPGEPAQLRATGFGRDQSPVGVEVLIGNRVEPAGAFTRTADGWETITVDIPAGVEGCCIPVAIRVGGRVSNYTTLSIGECPTTPAGTARIADIQLARGETEMQGFRMRTDSGAASFLRHETAVTSASPFPALTTSGSCMLVYAIEQDLPGSQATGLDAGRVQITGSQGMRELQRQSLGAYTSMLSRQMEAPQPIPGMPVTPAYLTPGTFSVTGSGGADVGPFRVEVKIPNYAVWANRERLAEVRRTAGMRAEWTNGTADQIVTLMGVSVTNTRPAAAAMFLCTAKGDAGAIAVPAYILEALPASGNREPGILTLTAAPAKLTEFTASGIDRGLAGYTHTQTLATRFE